MYQVRLKKEAKKQFAKIDQHYTKKILRMLFLLKENPYLGKPLEGDLAGQYTIRAWPYRIIYEIYRNKLIILVIAIKHRQGAYK